MHDSSPVLKNGIFAPPRGELLSCSRVAQPSAVLQAAASIRSFLDAPEDRYVLAPSWLVFHVRHEVAGLIMWGTPSAADLVPLFEIFRAFDSPLGEPLPRYFEVRRLVSVQQPIIAQIIQFVEAHHEPLGRILRSIAVVHRGGLGLAVTEGVRLLSALHFDWGTFEDSLEALTWLECRDPRALATEIDELSSLGAGGALLVHDVRAFCATDLRSATVDGAAAVLRLSTRTLQRRLAAHGTSFQRELNRTRISRAQALLASTARPIADVAREVGVEPRSFTALFRRITGCSPKAFRQAGVSGGVMRDRRSRSTMIRNQV